MSTLIRGKGLHVLPIECWSVNGRTRTNLFFSFTFSVCFRAMWRDYKVTCISHSRLQAFEKISLIHGTSKFRKAIMGHTIMLYRFSGGKKLAYLHEQIREGRIYVYVRSVVPSSVSSENILTCLHQSRTSGLVLCWVWLQCEICWKDWNIGHSIGPAHHTFHVSHIFVHMSETFVFACFGKLFKFSFDYKMLERCGSSFSNMVLCQEIENLCAY